ncbi:indolepyruvate ferredoxin oxidoreductase [Roseobacter sp. SK209-2-6]|uniref:indolepyruvate ferredoxin oxidoreductase family protein n=1 Tax=Roseobacter sp. SK209-2-6 TaxID=388739 RepID=UPI0000F3C560|nr:indolepyruvate ferredoxin oxidoreductase family protein [Roseobacter sp. SK209-2-6]EBA18630.1 indolepyruvate ferredoxin oxidoreductase [Roseobacter sp. SK209-2-6]
MPKDTADFSDISLSDKYNLDADRAYMTGTQALVRLCLMQSEYDRSAGLKTRGFVTGYRGSPLGDVDRQFSSAGKWLDEAGVVFQEGLNEDLAATAVWGTQQVNMRGEGTCDDVFALWYGKGPGVDRSGDVFRHANLAGTSGNGGVLALLGDDHTCESSTTCHQSEYALLDAMMPVLNPANIEEILSFGLHGWALSRYAGLWVGLKCVKDNVESSGSVTIPQGFAPQTPDFDLPPGGLSIRANDDRHDQESRLHQHKLDAARAYARSNMLDRVEFSGGKSPKIGVISTGKSWMDLVTAMTILGIDSTRAEEICLATYKVGMVWPLEPQGLKAFAAGLDTLIVVEEKRGLIETQVREILYGSSNAPMIFGKRDEVGQRLFPEEGALDAVMIARALAPRLPGIDGPAALRKYDRSAPPNLSAKRTPYFCAGCPHNSSTVLPHDARAYAGIGCHWMSQAMDRSTEGYTQMGGEGANWIGEAPFSARKHVFQNLGDGTYNHSGLMAIRATVASGVNMTFKILYNDAVAMTGGQTHEGGLSPYQIAAEVLAAGVSRLEIISDEPETVDCSKFTTVSKVHHRDNLNAIQLELAATQGVSALIYIQTCATEKRRRRKRGLMEASTKRVIINPEVCEGCGDCGIQSNCVAIAPLSTSLGTKRVIDQSSCNQDFSCIKGFCPSFVEIEGGALRKAAKDISFPSEVPEPLNLPNLDTPFSILLTGVGGTGVVTIGALLAMGAHLEGKGAGVIDMAGLAQKGGAVTCHIRIAAQPEDIKAIRIAQASADLMLACDALTGADVPAITLLKDDGWIIANRDLMTTGAFARDRNFSLPSDEIIGALEAAVPAGHAMTVNASEIAERILGDTIGANSFLLGAAWQKGQIPVSKPALYRAIELNGVSIEFNKAAFEWGRAWAYDPARIEPSGKQMAEGTHIEALPSLIEDRVNRLTAYQNARYGETYRQFVEQFSSLDKNPKKQLSVTVARNLFKLMAYKDEYEVARLLTDSSFEARIAEQFEGDYAIIYQLAPPMLPGRTTATGRPKKRSFGSWVRPAMHILKQGKVLRGTVFDPMGRTQERQRERALITQYRDDIIKYASNPQTAALDQLLQLAALPDQIRGFGPVKEASMVQAAEARASLISELAGANATSANTLNGA